MADDVKTYKEMTAGELVKTLGMDAEKWLDAFYEMHEEVSIYADRDVMRGWFANLIMAGYDHARGVSIHVEDDRFGPSIIEQANSTPSNPDEGAELIRRIDEALDETEKLKPYGIETMEILSACKTYIARG